MLFNLRLYTTTFLHFFSWLLNTCCVNSSFVFSFYSFSFLVRVFRTDSLQESKLFNYFYLARYFLGHPAKVFSLKKYFVLGRTYYNMEFGFILNRTRLYFPLSFWVFQIQPLVNLGLTRDFVFSKNQLQWILKDPSIFSEKKTNAGLFDLTDPLSFYLNYRDPSSSIFLTKKMLSSFKLVLNN